MKLSRLPGLLAALSAVLAAPACSSDDAKSGQPQACTLIGCGASVTMKARLPGSFAAIRSDSLEVCRNGDCLSGSFAKLPDAPAPGSGIGITFPDPLTLDQTHSPHAEASIWNDDGGGFRLEVAYWPWSTDDAIDGDRFSLTVRDAGGHAVVSVTRDVTYTISYPNGKACGPTCHQATIEVTGEPPDAGTEPDAR